jgi:hypothetical protein
MKRFIVFLLGLSLIINMVLWTACAKEDSLSELETTKEPTRETTEESITETTEETEEEAKEETESFSDSDIPNDLPLESDQVLKILKMPFDEGKSLTLFVLGKKSENAELFGVREIRVYDKKTFLQSVQVKEAIDIDGVDGIDDGYTACFTAEESAYLKDVNFDGYLDLEICGWVPNNSLPYYYWIWNNQKKRFEYAFCLQLVEIDTENKRLVAWYKVENGLYYTDYYHVNEKSELELLEREVEDVRPK